MDNNRILYDDWNKIFNQINILIIMIEKYVKIYLYLKIS